MKQKKPMPLSPNRPLLYLITSGATTERTTSSTDDFSQILKLTEAAVTAGIDLLQIREKNLSTRVLFELASQAAEITRGTSTQLVVNDRADVAVAVDADGVHLTAQSVPAEAVRPAFGADLLIGVSTHSRNEAVAAKNGGADFIVFGPVFDPLSKRTYGEAVGLEALRNVVSTVAPFPVVALGGISLDRVADCARAGAAGVAAITMFNELSRLVDVATEARLRFRQ